MRAMTGSTRTIWIMAVVAVVSLGAGIGLSKLIVSPSEAAANAAAPPAGPITVPVERRALANDVIMRGDAIYEDPVEVKVETGDIGGPAVVTGQVPEVGVDLNAGDVILEVTGRPVILLPGELPVYRTLRAGASGPDVAQLKAALAALGIDPGNTDSNTYDAATASAVRELYARVGYPAPSVSEEAETALEAAREMVSSAEEGVAQAQRDINAVGGASYSARVQAQAEVDSAQAALNDATAAYEMCEPDPANPCATEPVTAAQGRLATAIAVRDEANAAPDTSAQQAALAAAQRQLADARENLAEAQEAVVTPLPASEVVYLATTPRRVDAVNVRPGAMIAGTPVMNVSGATLQIAGTVATTDAELIAEGASVTITIPDGSEVAGTVQSVGAQDEDEDDADQTADPNRTRVVVVPGELTEEQRWMLQDANVRVVIPVSATEGEVMAVPIAALTAGPGGEERVEVLDDGEEESRLVTVETGLAAGGFVEVTPIDGSLEVGDRVVVGAAEVPEEEEAEEPDDSDDEATDEPAEDEPTEDAQE